MQAYDKEDLLVLLHGSINLGRQIIARLMFIGLFTILALCCLRFVGLLGLLLSLLLAIAADFVILNGKELQELIYK